LTVKLAAEADVTVHAESQLGRVGWPDDEMVDELVVGNGAAKLDIAVIMGFATIKLSQPLENVQEEGGSNESAN
jgi:hypothetical protein